MIALEQASKVSEHIKERSRRMFVRSLSPNAFIVTPKEKSKARRLVRIAITEAGTITIECIAKDTGEICPANLNSRLCSHANAALNRLYTTIKRNATRNLKANRPGYENSTGLKAKENHGQIRNNRRAG